MLPVLNAMTAVKLPPRGQAFGHTVTATGLYSAQETSSSFNSFGLVDLQLGGGAVLCDFLRPCHQLFWRSGGKAAYFAFDWHDDVPQERRAWAAIPELSSAMLLSLACHCRSQRHAGGLKSSRMAGTSSKNAQGPEQTDCSLRPGMPYQSMQLGPGNRQARPLPVLAIDPQMQTVVRVLATLKGPYPDSVPETRMPLSGAELWKASRKKVKHLMLGKRHRRLPNVCNALHQRIVVLPGFLRLTGDPVEPDLEVSIALTCPFRPDSSDRLEFLCRNLWASMPSVYYRVKAHGLGFGLQNHAWRAQFREDRSRKQRLAKESMATGTGQRRRLSTSERRKRTEFFASGLRRLRRLRRMQRLKAAKLDIQQHLTCIVMTRRAAAQQQLSAVAQVSTGFCYAADSFCHRDWAEISGQITKSMWDYAMSNPVLLGAFGLCEGAFFPLVFYSAARLPGSLVQVLNQSLIPFTVLFSFIFLSRRYDRIQLLGVLVVLCGVTLFTSLPRSTGSSAVFVILCIAAYGLQAA
ncbi:crtp2, partial [Symbiodinium sp. CCMP2456]